MGPPENAEGEQLSFSEKRKYFEKEIEDHKSVAPKAKEGKRFTYLSADEVAKLKLEDERRKGSMSEEALQDYVADTTDPSLYTSMITNIGKRSQPMDLGNIRTGSRAYDKFKRNSNSSTGSAGSPTDESESSPFTEQQRALEAEKKAIWRKARNQALEEEAMRAQAYNRRTCPQSVNSDTKDKSRQKSLNTDKQVP